MKQRIGGVLVLILGGVLLTSGLHGAGTTVGSPSPTTSLTSCGTAATGIVEPCPTGTVTFTEHDTTEVNRAARTSAAARPHAAPASWLVTITSDCAFPSGSRDTVTVPDGGSVTSDDLYLYPDSSGSTFCGYSFTETPVAGYTADFEPNNTSFDGSRDSNIPVDLTNTSLVTTPSPSSSSVLPTATTASPSAMPTTPIATISNGPTSSVAVLPTVTSAGPTLPFTGSNARVHASLVAGVGLLVLGLVMIFGSSRLRLRRRPRHH